MKRPYCAYFLIGYPGTGQTQFRGLLTKFQAHKGWYVFSVDAVLQKMADERKVSVFSLYNDHMEIVTQKLNESMKRIIDMRNNVIFDMPDLLSRAQRKQRLTIIPKEYMRRAVVFTPPLDVPNHLKTLGIVQNEMLKAPFEPATIEEGFDEVRPYNLLT